MDMTNQEYDKFVKAHEKPSPMGKNMVWAFLVGGGICTAGQLLLSALKTAGMDEETAGTTV